MPIKATRNEAATYAKMAAIIFMAPSFGFVHYWTVISFLNPCVAQRPHRGQYWFDATYSLRNVMKKMVATHAQNAAIACIT